jgi:hypothetical protein
MWCLLKILSYTSLLRIRLKLGSILLVTLKIPHLKDCCFSLHFPNLKLSKQYNAHSDLFELLD